MRQQDKPPKIMMREEFQRLADMRAEEASILAANGKEQGAYYLAGFAVECALRACIARRTRQHQYPPRNSGEYYGHDLEKLLGLADLKDRLDRESEENPDLKRNWGVVHDWSVDTRYEATGRSGADMIRAVASPDGVLQWIKQYW